MNVQEIAEMLVEREQTVSVAEAGHLRACRVLVQHGAGQFALVSGRGDCVHRRAEAEGSWRVRRVVRDEGNRQPGDGGGDGSRRARPYGD